MTGSDPQRWPVLTAAENEFHAALIVELLHSAGIESIIETFISGRSEVPGLIGPQVNVRVDEADLDAAREALAAGGTDIDQMEQDEIDEQPAYERRRMPLLAKVAFLATALVTALAVISMVIAALI